LAVILILALGLRLWGVGFGLPHLYHPDEGAIVMPALGILQTGDFNPHRFDYGSVHIYLLAVVYAVYFLYGARQGFFQSTQDIPVFQDYRAITTYPFPGVFLAGRMVSAILGALMVWSLYRISARVWGQRVGLIAAGLLAVLPAMVRHSHFIIADTSMGMLMLVALELIVMAYEQASYRSFLLAGVLTGLAASSKQPAIQLAPALLLAAVGQRLPSGRRFWMACMGLIGIVVGYLIGTPYALFDLPNFLDWQAYVVRLYGGVGRGPIYEGPSWLWHLRYILSGENAVLFIAALFGAYLAVRQKRWLGFILVSFPFLHWLSMGIQVVRYDRTWLPSAPFVCLFAAVAIAAISDRLSVRFSQLSHHGGGVFTVAALALVLPLLIGSVQMDIRLGALDVRTQALDWIDRNLPHGSRLAVDLSGPRLDSERWQLTRMLSLAEHDLSWYRSEGVEYLVMGEGMANNPNRTVVEEERFQVIRESCSPLTTVSGSTLGSPDVQIWIYDLNSCSDLQ
jgi:4-amino-4-deoxy-L-arabinose transferase-like glycosyltransferase